MTRSIQPGDRLKYDDVRHGDAVDYIEYGIQLPNGHIWWSGFDLVSGFAGVDWFNLHLRDNQDAAQKGYAKHLGNQGVVYNPEIHRLRFVTRRQQIRYTDPEELVGEERAELNQKAGS